MVPGSRPGQTAPLTRATEDYTYVIKSDWTLFQCILLSLFKENTVSKMEKSSFP